MTKKKNDLTFAESHAKLYADMIKFEEQENIGMMDEAIKETVKDKGFVKTNLQKEAMKATLKQVGGNHYKDCKVQPIEYIVGNDLTFCLKNQRSGMGFIKEFKDFAIKGNLIDMAVGFVMGIAFGKVVSSFIKGIFMPLIGKLVSGIDFSNLKYVLTPEQTDASGKVIVAESSVKYGEFVTVCIDFLCVAFVMFLLIKGINSLKKKEAALPPPPPKPTAEQVILSEIRDLLKK